MMSKYFQHPNGSLENVPPSRNDINEVRDNHENESRSVGTNRLAYKVENQSDPYKYKYYDANN